MRASELTTFQGSSSFSFAFIPFAACPILGTGECFAPDSQRSESIIHRLSLRRKRKIAFRSVGAAQEISNREISYLTNSEPGFMCVKMGGSAELLKPTSPDPPPLEEKPEKLSPSCPTFFLQPAISIQNSNEKLAQTFQVLFVRNHGKSPKRIIERGSFPVNKCIEPEAIRPNSMLLD